MRRRGQSPWPGDVPWESGPGRLMTVGVFSSPFASGHGVGFPLDLPRFPLASGLDPVLIHCTVCNELIADRVRI